MKRENKCTIGRGLLAAVGASVASLAIGINPALAFVVTVLSYSLAALAEAVWLHFNH